MNPQTNPFDILPAQIFNILGTGAYVNLQRHHVAVLLRIYELAEFNRFGLTREVVLAEIVDYLESADATAEIADAIDADQPAEAKAAKSEGASGSRTVQEYAAWMLRRLSEAGWLEREQHADYTEYIILPDYAFTLLEAFRTIQEQKPREYTGHLYAAHQLLTSENEDFSPAYAVTQAYDNVRQMVRGLNELNQNIRRYTDRVTRGKDVPELIRMQFDEYAPALGAAYHALKTSDHVSRYRRGIVTRLRGWQMDQEWLDHAASDLALQRRLTPAQAADEISHALRFIVEQVESIDPLLEEVDRRHAQYLRTSLRQIRYQLVSGGGSFKDRLVTMTQQLARIQEDGVALLPADVSVFQYAPVDVPDTNSFYTMPTHRAPFVPATIERLFLDPDAVARFRQATLSQIGSAITPAKIERFVHEFLDGHRRMHANDLPPAFFADMEWAIFALAYGHHPEVDYGVEIADGEPVTIGPYLIQPFELTRLR
jgi:hypothetical protein